MIKYVAILRRKPGTTREAFLDSWLGRHRSLAEDLPHIQQVEFLPSVEADAVPADYDGVGILSFHSVEDLNDSLRSTQAIALRSDTATFADVASVTRVVVSDDQAQDRR